MKKKAPARNQRKSTRKQLKQQDLLEVTVRSAKAVEQRNRKLVTWACVLFLFAAGAGGVYYGAREALRRFFWENPDFQVSEIEVTTDGSLAREQILEASGIREGRNILATNISKAHENLTQLPQVEGAVIHRQFPNKITININERKPIAWIAAKYDEDPTVYASSWLVDGMGILIKSKNQLPEYFHLPVIYGVQTEKLDATKPLDTPELKAALDLVRLNSDSAAQARFQVRSIDVSKGYCMVATDRNHARVTFGLDRLDFQMERLMTVLDHIDQSKRELQTLNLMVQRNVPVTYMPPPDVPADEAKPVAEVKADKPKPAPILKKTEPPMSPSVAKAKPVVPVKKAGRVRSETNESKPVRRATPVSSQN